MTFRYSMCMDNRTKMSAFISDLTYLDACNEDIEFVTRYDTPQAAWEACDDASFMEWYLDKLGRIEEIDPARRQYYAARDDAWRQHNTAECETSSQHNAASNEAWRQYYAAVDPAWRQYVRDIRGIIPIIPALT